MERVVVALESAFQAAGKPAPPVPSINYSVELSDPALRVRFWILSLIGYV